MIYSFRVDKDLKVDEYLTNTKIRFEESNQVFIKNYHHKLVSLSNDDLVVLVCSEIAIPPAYLLGFIPLVIGIAISSIITTVAGVIVLSLGYIWSKSFQIWAFKQGLKKTGYEGKIKILRCDECLELIAFGSN